MYSRVAFRGASKFLITTRIVSSLPIHFSMKPSCPHTITRTNTYEFSNFQPSTSSLQQSKVKFTDSQSSSIRLKCFKSLRSRNKLRKTFLLRSYPDHSGTEETAINHYKNMGITLSCGTRIRNTPT
ncbi:unnamed protein product [Allacma fusca]|uniref:Uncharacterized protein n=1 Tax=Allacma fusca TaxID=39272 RepID=A0A8J2LJ42_9HEXA|nr:unnamed protein product [Allacma fusca]